jgi:hippurate hydrolase
VAAVALAAACGVPRAPAADAPPSSGPPAASPAAGELLTPIVGREYPSLEKLYRLIHENPELSLHEAQTAARLATELRTAGYEVTANVGGHGVVAVMRNGPGKTLLVRADMDALPVRRRPGRRSPAR